MSPAVRKFDGRDFRGQEGDAWKGHVADPAIPETVSWRRGKLWRQDWINRQYLSTVAQHPQTLTFDAGLEFIETNKASDNWFLQSKPSIRTSPSSATDGHKARYPHSYQGAHFDWPDYRVAVEDPAAVEHARMEYAALLSMCDDFLGRVLDAMDAHDLWRDTMLIVCTDHGFLLGERNWWGKNCPALVRRDHPHAAVHLGSRSGHAGERRKRLVQTPKGFRFPREIIAYAVWAYHRFALSTADVASSMPRLEGKTWVMPSQTCASTPAAPSA